MTIAAVLKEKGAAIISVAPETGMADVAHVIPPSASARWW